MSETLIGALSVDQFCEMYQVGRTSAYALIGAGKLRAVKHGRRTKILRRDAEAWAATLQPLTLNAA